MPTPSTETSRSRAEAAEAARTGVWRQPEPALRRAAALAGIAVLLLLGSVLRAEAIGGSHRVSADENSVAANANAMLEGVPYRTFRWAPGTSFVFALATRLHGRHRLTVERHAHSTAQYVQLAIEVTTLAVVAVVAWAMAGPWAALLAIALAALYLPLILVTRTYLSEPFGGLMILLTFAAAAWARQRGWRALAAAGVLAGLGCLTREDLFPGVVVIAVAIMWSLWRASRRRAISCGAVYLACAVVVITPWVIYASGRVGRFVPITDGGPDAFFIGSYLPGGGEQYPDVESFRSQICRHYPADCHHLVSRGTADMFKLIEARYPGLSANAAITKADLENVRRYALGRPFAFAGMLANKTWRLWSYPWSGGNGYGQHPQADTSRVQHLIFTGLALLGLLGGALLSRRWSLITVTFGLGAITLLNILVNAQGRDNVRLMPLLFTFGASGLWLVGKRLVPKARP